MSLEDYRNTFPSDMILEKMFGTKKQLLRRVVFVKNIQLFFWPLRLYSDAGIANVWKNPELRFSFNPLRWVRLFPFVVSKRKYGKIHDVYSDRRRDFDYDIRRTGIHLMRMEEDVPSDKFERLCVVEHGMFGSAVNKEALGVSEDIERMLCAEFSAHILSGHLDEPEEWWEYIVEDDSVFMDRKLNADAILVEIKENRRSYFQNVTSSGPSYKV